MKSKRLPTLPPEYRKPDELPPVRPEQLVYDIAPRAHHAPFEGGVPLDYPAVEALPEFLARIPVEALLPACRNFNAAIARAPSGELLLAYRREHWNALNGIGIARLSADLAVTGNVALEFPDEGVKGVHWEDPRLCSVAGELLLICAWVKFGAPSICRQRLWKLDPRTLQPAEEIVLPYGRSGEGRVEKNWMPFEGKDGTLHLVYEQRPHTVIAHPSSTGHTTPGLSEWYAPGRYLSGRTPPILLPTGRHYLAFFGGHVKHEWRGARYFIGALLFEAAVPFRIAYATREPLAWGTEASRTYLSARPASGHPLCLYPAGAVLNDSELIVSCGVNDSYNVLLRYNLESLCARMTPVDAEGRWK